MMEMLKGIEAYLNSLNHVPMVKFIGTGTEHIVLAMLEQLDTVPFSPEENYTVQILKRDCRAFLDELSLAVAEKCAVLRDCEGPTYQESAEDYADSWYETPSQSEKEEDDLPF